MSWYGGSVAGAPGYQHQSQSLTYPQPGYRQQQTPQVGSQPNHGQYQPSYPHPAPGPPQRPPDFRPQKKKGNPIITRYPPPPGYRGPAQPQGLFGANQHPSQYQSPQTGHLQASPTTLTSPAHGYPTHSVNNGFPSQNYVPHSSTFPPPRHPYAQNVQWPKLGHPSNQSYSQHQNQSMQGYSTPQSAHSAHGSATGWPLVHHDQSSYPPNSHHSPTSSCSLNTTQSVDPNSTSTPAVTGLVTAQPSQPPNQPASAVSENDSNGKPSLFLAWDDWDFDFDGAIWPKSNEPVDPNLSLGVIIWHPAKQMTRALPSTFADAEEQALKPTPEKLDNGESVSMYFMAENSHEAFLDVRQTDEWENIRDDPIFVTFTDEEMDNNLISIDDCIAERDRPEESRNDGKESEDEEMKDTTWDIMGNLEQVLSRNNGVTKAEIEEQENPLPNQTQEDILALLGVTGSPKPPSNHSVIIPFPASDELVPTPLPETRQGGTPSIGHSKPANPPQRAHSFGGYKSFSDGRVSQGAYGSMSSASKPRPPPPLSLEDLRHNSWPASQQNDHRINTPGGNHTLSERRDRTTTGLNFTANSSIDNKQGLPAKPALQRSDSSRKRSYQDTDQEDEKHQQSDDQAKRKRRLQVDAAYSRR